MSQERSPPLVTRGQKSEVRDQRSENPHSAIRTQQFPLLFNQRSEISGQKIRIPHSAIPPALTPLLFARRLAAPRAPLPARSRRRHAGKVAQRLFRWTGTGAEDVEIVDCH
jgi:hypothetical protein